MTPIAICLSSSVNAGHAIEVSVGVSSIGLFTTATGQLHCTAVPAMWPQGDLHWAILRTQDKLWTHTHGSHVCLSGDHMSR